MIFGKPSQIRALFILLVCRLCFLPYTHHAAALPSPTCLDKLKRNAARPYASLPMPQTSSKDSTNRMLPAEAKWRMGTKRSEAGPKGGEKEPRQSLHQTSSVFRGQRSKKSAREAEAENGGQQKQQRETMGEKAERTSDRASRMQEYAMLESSVSTSRSNHDARDGRQEIERSRSEIVEIDDSDVAEIQHLTEGLLRLSTDGSSSPLHSSWEDSDTTMELLVPPIESLPKTAQGGAQQSDHIDNVITDLPAAQQSAEITTSELKKPGKGRPRKKLIAVDAKPPKPKAGSQKQPSTSHTGRRKACAQTSGKGTARQNETAEAAASAGGDTAHQGESGAQRAAEVASKQPLTLGHQPETWPSWAGQRVRVCRIAVEGNPIALKRPRHRIGGHTYDPNYRDKKMFLNGCAEQLPGQPLGGPIALSITFELPRPKLHFSKAKKTMGHLKQNVPALPCTVPDLDNLVKFVLDALNEKLYEDDRQICEIAARKVYRSIPGEGRTLVEAALLQ